MSPFTAGQWHQFGAQALDTFHEPRIVPHVFPVAHVGRKLLVSSHLGHLFTDIRRYGSQQLLVGELREILPASVFDLVTPFAEKLEILSDVVLPVVIPMMDDPFLVGRVDQVFLASFAVTDLGLDDWPLLDKKRYPVLPSVVSGASTLRVTRTDAIAGAQLLTLCSLSGASCGLFSLHRCTLGAIEVGRCCRIECHAASTANFLLEWFHGSLRL